MECFQKDGSNIDLRKLKSLNPCSNGMLSEDTIQGKNAEDVVSLNPCSNGMLSEVFSYHMCNDCKES